MTATSEQVVSIDNKLKGYLASIPRCYPNRSNIALQLVEMYVRETNTDPNTFCQNGMEIIYAYLKEKEKKEREEAEHERINMQIWREVPDDTPEYDIWEYWDPDKEEWIKGASPTKTRGDALLKGEDPAAADGRCSLWPLRPPAGCHIGRRGGITGTTHR